MSQIIPFTFNNTKLRTLNIDGEPWFVLADVLKTLGMSRKPSAVVEEQTKQLEQQKPKVLFADSVNASHTTILIGELAKILKGNGIDTGANRLFAWMRDNGYLIKRRGSDWNMPTQTAMDKGLFHIKETAITHSDGHVTISKTTKVTGKGQQYFINKFMNTQLIPA